MLICQVVSGLMYGGGQRVALDLAAGLHNRRGLRTLTVLLGNRVSPAMPRVESDCVQLDIYDGRYNRPGTLLRTAHALAGVLRESRADIVHSHGWDADVISGLAASATGARHVVHQHVVARWTSSPRVVHYMRRAVTRLALDRRTTDWIAVSGAVRDSLRPLTWLKPELIRVIWNGVDIQRIRPAVGGTTRRRLAIGVAARLAPKKGLEELIAAVAELGRRGLDCDLRIAGDGPMWAKLRDVATRAGVSGRVTFLGHWQDMDAFYASVDVCALPSYSEGLPLTLLEAMSSGLPVVSTRVGGIPELVSEGVNGRLVEPGDVQSLSDALQALLTDTGVRSRMGREGRRIVEHKFSLGRMLDEISSVYSHSLHAA